LNDDVKDTAVDETNDGADGTESIDVTETEEA